MDEELRTLLKALLDGQIRLAEGQVKMEASIGRLAERQDRTEAAIDRMSYKVSVMAEHLDDYGAQIVRGFTNAGQRNGDIEGRLSKLEAEVESLKNPSPQD